MKREYSLAISAVVITAMCAVMLYSPATDANVKDWATIIALLTFLWAGMIRDRRVVFYCYTAMLLVWGATFAHWMWAYPVVLIAANFVAVVLAAIDCIIAEGISAT